MSNRYFRLPAAALVAVGALAGSATADKIDSLSIAPSGNAFDQTPVPNDTRTPRVPDQDRTWLSFGMQYALGNGSSLDFGYTHLFLPDASIDLTVADPANVARGNLAGSFSLDADIFVIQFKTNL